MERVGVDRSERNRLHSAFEIEGRSTGMGARERLEIKETITGRAKIKVINTSKTGNHWKEILFITPDFSGTVHHISVSNSGRHWCEVLVFENGKLKERIESIEGLCPIHHRNTYYTYLERGEGAK